MHASYELITATSHNSNRTWHRVGITSCQAHEPAARARESERERERESEKARERARQRARDSKREGERERERELLISVSRYLSFLIDT